MIIWFFGATQVIKQFASCIFELLRDLAETKVSMKNLCVLASQLGVIFKIPPRHKFWVSETPVFNSCLKNKNQQTSKDMLFVCFWANTLIVGMAMEQNTKWWQKWLKTLRWTDPQCVHCGRKLKKFHVLTKSFCPWWQCCTTHLQFHNWMCSHHWNSWAEDYVRTLSAKQPPLHNFLCPHNFPSQKHLMHALMHVTQASHDMHHHIASFNLSLPSLTAGAFVMIGVIIGMFLVFHQQNKELGHSLHWWKPSVLCSSHAVTKQSWRTFDAKTMWNGIHHGRLGLQQCNHFFCCAPASLFH